MAPRDAVVSVCQRGGASIGSNGDEGAFEEEPGDEVVGDK